MRIEKVYFKSIDNLNMIGLLHLPEKDKKVDTVVISMHGITSNCLKYREDVLARMFTDIGVAYFAFNNRGHDIINTYDKITDDDMHFYGSGAENIYDSYYDIKAAILYMQRMGYNNIILQGHSMGCTKVVYSYNEFIENHEDSILDSIKGVILLSMVDIPTALKKILDKSYKKVISYLQLLNKKGKGDRLIILDANTPPIKPSTILNYVENNEKINFARFGDSRYAFKELNNIKVPLFMRWGNIKELIFQDPKELVEFMNEKIKKEDKNISYIKGANHNYTGKEEELGEQLCTWYLKEVKNENNKSRSTSKNSK